MGKIRQASRGFFHGLGRIAIMWGGLLAATSATAAEKWPTTEFEVFPGPPIARHWGDTQIADYLDHLPTFSSDELPAATREQIAAALSKTARRYESMGFPPPRLEPLVTTKHGTKAYRVYVCKKSWLDKVEDELIGEDPFEVAIPGLPALRSIWEACAEVAAHNGSCAETQGFRNYLYFNSEKLFAGQTLNGWDYGTLAHELFHAIHANMASGRGEAPCKTGQWITEGLADAVSIDLVGELWPHVSLDSFNDVKRYGVRRYDQPLPHRGHTYTSSSFWRHMGEWYHAALSNGGQRAGSAQTESDYGFLVHLLDRPIAGSPGFERELEWLDEGLRSTRGINTNAATVYAHFVAAFADQLRTRVVPGRGGTPPAKAPRNRLEKWLKVLFDSCPSVELSGNTPVVAKKLSVEDVGARCFELSVKSTKAKPSPSQVSVTMSVGPATRDELTALWIGKTGGMEVGPLMVFGSPERSSSAPGYGTTQFKIDVGDPTIFVMANVAMLAHQGADHHPTVTFTVPGWNSSLTKPPAKKKLPVETKKETEKKTAQGATDPDSEYAATMQQQFENSLGEVTSVGLGTTETQRRYRPRPGCKDKRLEYNICGPQLEIELELASAASSVLAVSVPGGPGSSGVAVGLDTTDLAKMAGLARASEDMKPSRIEAGKIDIAIPRIDYGFKGSFQNAQITVSKEGDGRYIAETQTGKVLDTGPAGPIRRRVPSGIVTIQEYSPLILRGTFEATLLDEDVARRTSHDEVTPVATTIQGEFAIPNAFTSDDDYELDKAASLAQGVVAPRFNSMMNAPEGMQPGHLVGPEVIELLCAQGVDEYLLQGMGISASCTDAASGGPGSSGEPVPEDCDCSCTEFSSPERERCAPACGSRYEQCATAALSGDIEELRRLLHASNFPPETHAQVIEHFRELDEDERPYYLDSMRKAVSGE